MYPYPYCPHIILCYREINTIAIRSHRGNKAYSEFEGRKAPIIILRNHIFYRKHTGNIRLDKETVTGALYKCQFERNGCLKKLVLVSL
jgi:hypothetical protein